jgi:3-methyladenine DNA glycosylase Mpg
LEETKKVPDPEKNLSPSFYSKDPVVVARALLGKCLVRELNGEVLEGTIVETEDVGGARAGLHLQRA